MIREDPSGWYLPTDDTYFARFVAGPAPKSNGFQRDHLLKAFKYVRTWNTAVDVGAHVGFWTWDLAKKFATVYAFEPTTANFLCLLQNLDKFDNVIVRNVAVGEREGWCTIHNDKERPGNTGSNYIKLDEGGDIPVVALDAMMIPSCDLLKIDVEGYEFQVLRGAAGLIRKHRPVVIMECDKKFEDRYDLPHGAAEQWLLSRGYREVAHMRPDKVFVPRA